MTTAIVATLVLFFPLICGICDALLRENKVGRAVVWSATVLPLLGFLSWGLLTGMGRAIDGTIIAVIVAAVWGMLFMVGQKIGRPFAEAFADQRRSRRLSNLKDEFL